MAESLFRAFGSNFLGHSPKWYKQVILLCLILNPIIYFTIGSFSAGWVLVGEFIFALAMTPKCYPLQPGGLLALESVAIGMTSPENVLKEVANNFEVVLLLIFMVAGIFFMKDLLFYIFTRILIGVRSKVGLSLLFCSVAAVLSAFLDALTVAAVLISVCVGFYRIYHRVACGRSHHVDEHDHTDDSQLHDAHEEELSQFRSFLRSLLMHGAIGTALGGVCTLVGEPQNLLIANIADWNFAEFFMKMAPVSLPAFAAGLLTCAFLEKTGILGYGSVLPEEVRVVLSDFVDYRNKKRDARQRARLISQAVVGILLVIALALHLAAVGLVGLMVLILLTAINGITEEQRLGKAFEESLPFVSLLVTFFAVVSVIHQQELFEPIIEKALDMDEGTQPGIFFIASGALSMISDNVFVATVYINQVHAQLDAGAISREHFDSLAIAINTGTNLPSVATPNGQAAFLFLLTSSLAPLIHLSYGRMVLLALPYTIVLSVVGFLSVYFLL